ncbi:AlpA family phage regulatory protein [Acidiphilium sp. PA]|uniref:helix-turn-helix transcriptional regulator n=1 Tax=Acidiphilium sp. PA TaxID=2871705 RepID=UPI002243AB69|nr:AlpA family phage regulatory protein [Acidiphilium sp. PA]MCW8309113.1 AlpA family phage regulatory protein [Acidiphilium sp. PA]
MKFIRYPELKDRGIPWTRVHLGRLVRAGEFPPPVNLGGNSIAWVEAEIDAWAAERAASRPAVHHAAN